MKHSYTPRPLRESFGSRTAHDIQRDLELMRKMYAERRSLNHHRHERMVGLGLLTAMVAVPAIATIVVLIYR
jgi:hypothetical protein